MVICGFLHIYIYEHINIFFSQSYKLFSCLAQRPWSGTDVTIFHFYAELEKLTPLLRLEFKKHWILPYQNPSHKDKWQWFPCKYFNFQVIEELRRVFSDMRVFQSYQWEAHYCFCEQVLWNLHSQFISSILIISIGIAQSSALDFVVLAAFGDLKWKSQTIG